MYQIIYVNPDGTRTTVNQTAYVQEALEIVYDAMIKATDDQIVKLVGPQGEEVPF